MSFNFILGGGLAGLGSGLVKQRDDEVLEKRQTMLQGLRQKFQREQQERGFEFRREEATEDRKFQRGLRAQPSGFRKADEGGLAPITGGPADPAYLREKTKATTKPDRRTMGQEATAQQIKTARSIMDQWERAAKGKNMTLADYVSERARKTNPLTKLPEPDYRSDAIRLARMAARPIPGESDADAKSWAQKFYGIDQGDDGKKSFFKREVERQAAEDAKPKPGSQITIGGTNYLVVRQEPDGTLIVRDKNGKEFRAGRGR